MTNHEIRTTMKAFLELPLRILTHNIRYATTSPEEGEELWNVRAPRLINELQFNMRHTPAGIICLQEVLHVQLEDILGGLNGKNTTFQMVTRDSNFTDRISPVPVSQLALMNPEKSSSKVEWTYIGVAREDGRKSGEYSPIFFRPSIWKLLEFRTIWLSETPEKPSKGWDAASTRILTIGVLKHLKSKQKLIAMNTHLDDQGTLARQNAAKLILKHIKLYRTKYAGTHLFLAGDFNSKIDGEAYMVVTSKHSSMYDVHNLVSKEQIYGNLNTFTGFGDDEPQRIDFVFVDNDKRWRTEGYGVLANLFEDGVFLSDHRAVVADLTLHERH